MNVLIDGPPEVAIEAGLATVKGTSGGVPLVVTMRIQDALILCHRFDQAYNTVAAQADVIPFKRKASEIA